MSNIIADIKRTESHDSLQLEWVTTYESLTEVVAKSEDGSVSQDDFLAEELIIAAALGYSLSSKADDAIDEIMDVLDGNISRLDDVLLSLRSEFSEVFDTSTQAQVTQSLIREMRKGAGRAGGYNLIQELTIRQNVLDGMVNSTKYYTNNYFNRFVVPSLQDAVDKYIFTGNADNEAFKIIRQGLHDRLKSVPYWRTVANAAASRSYHYGMLKAGSQSGMRGYVLDATIDVKTSKTCKELDGKEFWIADATQLIERVAQTEDIEEVKELMPWMKYDDIKNLSNDDLVDRGVMVPPFHGNCRTTLRLLSGF